jgi:hypothetical protein
LIPPTLTRRLDKLLAMEKKNKQLKEAEDKVTEILHRAEESAGRSFELQKTYLDRDIKLTYTPDREAFISGQIEHCKAIIKGLAGFDGLMNDLPVHVRTYDPREASRRFAIFDLLDGMASEQDLFRVFTMKYVAYLKIDYLQSWNHADPIYSLIKPEYRDLAKKVLPAIKERIDRKVPDRTKGAAEIIKACFALKFNEIMVEFLDNDGNVCISNFYRHLDDYFDRSTKHQAYQSAIHRQWVTPNYLEYDDLITEIQEQA